MPDMEISGSTGDFINFVAGDGVGVSVSAFWCDRSEETKLRLLFKDNNVVVSEAVWNGRSIQWVGEPLRQIKVEGRKAITIVE